MASNNSGNSMGRTQVVRIRSQVLVAFLFLTIPVISITVQADHEWDHRYTLTGTVRDVNGDLVSSLDVALDCSTGMTDSDLCNHNSGRESTTSMSGNYEVMLHIHSSDHGKQIVLLANGETFTHIIDLTGPDGEMDEEDRFVTMDIRLNSEVSMLLTFLPGIIFFSLVLLTGLFFMKRSEMWIFKPKSVVTKRVGPELVQCPRCDAELREWNLVRHLTQKHHISREEAEQLIAGEEPAE